MIDENTLLSFRSMFNDARQLEKDYLLNLILKTISINKASNYLEFKGGTALYVLHGLDRFSEDLDFSYIGDGNSIASIIDGLLAPVLRDFGLSYVISKNKGNILAKDNDGKIVGSRTEIFVNGPLFEKTGTRHKIKIDISSRHDLIMKPEPAKFVSKYNDIGTVLLNAMPLEEILIEKLCAIAERNEARDIYDAYFILKYKDIRFNRDLFNNKIKLRNETYAVQDVRKKVRSIKSSLWKEELGYLVNRLPNLNDVRDLLIAVLNKS